jgi:hypothetical protein
MIPTNAAREVLMVSFAMSSNPLDMSISKRT